MLQSLHSMKGVHAEEIEVMSAAEQWIHFHPEVKEELDPFVPLINNSVDNCKYLLVLRNSHIPSMRNRFE